MSTITEAPLAVPVVSHVPWWRGKIVQVGAVIAVMWLAYRGWKSEYAWPNDLVWNGLQAKFDSIQTYLIDQRLEGGGGVELGLEAVPDEVVRPGVLALPTAGISRR